ncbi:MAG: hypothetical protein ABR950_01905 [Candidatus Dormibacteria bacterium]|jgi:hypothetical protein
MAEVGGSVELEERLAELERQHSEGTLTEIGYNLRRNLLITRSEELARRRSAAAVATLPQDPARPSRRAAPPGPRPALPERGATRPAARARTQAPAPAAAPATDRRSRLASRPVLIAAAVIVAAAAAFGIHRVVSGPAVPASTTAADPGGGGVASAPTAQATPSPSETITPVPPPTVIDVTQATLTGGSVTLLGYADHFASGSSINNPLPPGGFYAAVELRICAGPAGATVSPFQFVLTETGQTAQIGVATGPTVGRQPALALQQLAAGSCATGWLSYGVTSRPTGMDDTGDDLTWAIPG